MLDGMAFDPPTLRHSLGVLRSSQAIRRYQEAGRAWPERKRIWPFGCVTGRARVGRLRKRLSEWPERLTCLVVMAKQRYRFTVEMAGVGETPEDAWEDAVECFTGEASVTAVDLDHDQEDLV